MAKVVEHRKFSKTDIDANNNKYWFVWFYDDGRIETQNGRQGAMGVRRFITATGRTAYETKVREKFRKGYIENKTADVQGSDDAVISSVANSKLKDIARKQIKSTNPLTQKLIDYLVTVNAHQISAATGGKIVFDTSTAQFKTTVGVILPSQITEARVLLDDLSVFVDNRDWDNYDFKPKLNKYLSLIPRDFGLKKVTPEYILPDLNKVQSENAILDGLDASFAGLVKTDDSKKKKDDAPKVFDVQLKLIEDTKVTNKLSKLFRSTIKHGHVTRSYKIKTVYGVTIANMKSAFDKHGRVLTNIKQLWHGTKASNLLSILKQGLVIPPSHSSHCTGRMYGNGLYFSSISTKALNYATGFWGSGGSSKRVFMFLADVAMGKYYLANSGWNDNLPKQGYDSTWAKGGRSGVINDEMIVYKLRQANLVYLIEFEDTGRSY